MKKLIALLLVLAMVACMFVGCGGSDEPTEPETTETTEPGGEEAAPAGDGSVDYSSMKIGMLLNNTVTDGGWNQAMAESLRGSQAELGLTDDQIIIIESIPDGGAEADSTIVQLVDEGCNLIIGASSGFTTNVNAACAQYPDVYFTQFEGASAENYCSFTCKDIEAIFLCGYAAGLMSEVNELGFVAAQPQASVVRAINAWSAGAKAANPDATVQVAWVNSWYDPAGDKECANSLMQTGIQCLGYHGSTTAVAQAAAENGGYATGFHVDMHDYAPTAILTSFMWRWTPIFNEIITNVAANTWSSEIVFKGLADDACAVAPWNTDIMPEDVVAQCDEMKAAIVDGSYVVMEGPLVDNEGNQIIGEGETLSLEQLVDCYWLLDNVIGDLP